MPHAVLVGVGATLLMDLWLVLLKRTGVPTMDFALLGRWVGHVFRGRFAHEAIRRAAPIAGETALGWLAHYAIGVAFAALLVGLQGAAWLRSPTWPAALAWGLATAAAPLFVLQPAMGAGIASRRTPSPLKNSLRSLANHAVFGLGLYVSAAALARLAA
ncbi:MAG: DUF2938 family protein [Rubrivivax sp.]|nr:DUF2938 family protein [Rubrivivax sp.]